MTGTARDVPGPVLRPAFRLRAAFDAPERLASPDEARPAASPGPGQAPVEACASAVNPPDVKAALGQTPHLVRRRSTGRDVAGVVRESAAALPGRGPWPAGAISA